MREKKIQLFKTPLVVNIRFYSWLSLLGWLVGTFGFLEIKAARAEFPSPCTRVDPDLEFSVFVDPNPNLLTDQGDIKQMTLQLYNQMLNEDGTKPCTEGVVADGVTKIIIGFSQGPKGALAPAAGSGEAVFRIMSASDGTDGVLSLFPGINGTVENGGNQVTTQSVFPALFPGPVPDFHDYFVVYTPPPDFGQLDGETREVTIEAKNFTFPFAPFAHITLTLHRPPVLCVHGMGDEASGCESMVQALKKAGFMAYPVDYGDVAWDAFNTTPVAVFVKQLEHELEKYRKNGIAITQVDVVAHSMGNLVTRASTKMADRPYKRKENFNEGDIHRLVSIGAPHFGSKLAKFFMDAMDAINKETPNGGECVKDAMREVHLNPDGGAIASLTTGSKELQWLNQGKFEVPTHTVVGIDLGLAVTIVDRLARNTFAKLYQTHCNNRGPAFPDSMDALFGENHDIIVEESSQQGYAASQQTTSVSGVVHSVSVFKLFAEMESSSIHDSTSMLLNVPSDSFTTP